jgi:hypothetical protein
MVEKRASRSVFHMRTKRLLVSILTPTALMLACGASVPEGGDPADVGQTSSALYKGDTQDTEVIARAKYWFDEGKAHHMGDYTNSYCHITGKNSDGTKDSSCHRDMEGNGEYPNTHFYRRDCSGMASMAVHMGYSTNTAGFRDGDFGFEILSDDADAKPGDLLLSTAKSSNACKYGNHTIIFEEWIDGSHWRGYSGGSMPPTHNVYTVSKSNGTITNMDRYDGCDRVFHAWRSPHVIHSSKTCKVKSCSQLGLDCGSVSADENCGTALHCGGCGSGETCDSGQCVQAPSDSYAKATWSGTLRNQGECVDVGGSSSIAMTTCTNGLDETWHMTSDRHLKSDKTAKCIAPDSVEVGSATSQQTCGGDDQIWRFRSMRVLNGQTGYCMDVPMADYHVGQRVIQWPCHGADNQLFTYKPQTGEIEIQGYCLDAGTAEGGAQVTLQHCDDSASQRWNDAHGGFVSAVATQSPRCLALEGGASAGANANLVVHNCNDSVEQMWALRGHIENYDDTLCLKNGTDGSLKLTACEDAHPAQVFTFWMNP